MNEALFIGVYPGLTSSQLDYVGDCLVSFCASHTTRNAA
jgi:hypothetical protein